MNYDGYGWIKVKKHKFDPQKSWEENYKDLDRHHVEETTFLINKVRELAVRKWRVMRQDDNGVKYEVETNLDKAQAESKLKEIENGHKQIYWIEAI